MLDRSEMDAQFTFAYGVLESSVEPVGIASDAVGYFRRYERAIDWASPSGASEFCRGQNSYSVKLELGHDLIPLNNYFEHLNPVLHRIFARAARRISWTKLHEDLKTYVAAHPRAADGSQPGGV